MIISNNRREERLKVISALESMVNGVYLLYSPPVQAGNKSLLWE